MASLSDATPGLGGSIQNSGSTAAVLTLSSTGGSTTFSGLIAGGGSLGSINLIVRGAGLQAPGRHQHLHGWHDNHAGTLQLGSDFALGPGGLTGNNGTLDLAGFSPTLLSLSGSGCVITDRRRPTPRHSPFPSRRPRISAARCKTVPARLPVLVLDGPGELILSGRDTYGGGTIVTAGTLAVTTAGALARGREA